MAFCLLLPVMPAMNVSASTYDEPIWVYETVTGPRTVAMSADGEYIAVGTGDVHSTSGALYLFEKDNGTPLWNYTNENCVGPGSEPPFSYCVIEYVSISANGDYIVIGSRDHNISLFGKESNIPLWTYKVEDYEISSISISANGDYIFATSQDDDYTSFFFSKESDVPLWTCGYSCLGDWIETSAMSDDGEYIVLSTESKNIYLLNKDSNTPLWNYSARGHISVIDISSDGEYIAVGAGYWNEPNSTLSLFGKADNTPLWEANITVNEGGIGSIAISADGAYIALGSLNYTTDDTNGFKNNNIHLFGKDSNIPLWTYNLGEDCYCMALSIAISADGEYIAVGTDNGKLHLFNKDSNIPLWSYITSRMYGVSVVSVDISADGNYIVAAGSGSWDFPIYFFDKEVKNSFACDKGNSIFPNSWVNDGVYDCWDGADEDEVGYFWCEGSNELLYGQIMNDGVEDCEDGSDEKVFEEVNNETTEEETNDETTEETSEETEEETTEEETTEANDETGEVLDESGLPGLGLLVALVTVFAVASARRRF